MTKRLLDWLEKISAGSLLVGMYQNNLAAMFIGIITLTIILAATTKEQK